MFCYLRTSNHGYEDRLKPIRYQEKSFGDITIANDVWVAGHVSVLKGVGIGTHSVIAAGSVVNSDVPQYSVFGGVPAKLIKQVQ